MSRGYVRPLAAALSVLWLSIATSDPLTIPDEADVPSGQKRGMTINDQMRIRRIMQLSLSPDGREVLFYLAQSDPAANLHRTGWFVAPTVPDAHARYLFDAGPIHIDRAGSGRLQSNLLGRPGAWAPDGQWIAFVRENGDGAQVWRILGTGGEARQVTHNAADVEEFVWSADGKRILYAVGRDRDVLAAREEGLRGWLYDERMEAGYPTEVMWPTCIRGPFDRVWTVRYRCERTVWVADIESGAEHRASREQIEEFNALRTPDFHARMLEGQNEQLVTPSPDGKRVAWLANADPKTHTGLLPPLALHVSASGDRARGRQCTYESCQGSISALWWNASSNEIVFLRAEGHRKSVTALYSWRPDRGAPRKLLSLDGSLESCGMGRGRIVCARADWTRPDYLVSIDAHSGAMETVLDPNPEFDHFRFPKIEKLEWLDANGHAAMGHFVYPANYENGKRYPLVVVTYAFGGYLRDVGDEHAIFPMAEEGFAVLCYSLPFTQETSRIADPNKARLANWSTPRAGAMYWAIDRLDERGLIDPHRMGVSGISNGSTIVDEALLDPRRHFAAASAGSTRHPVTYFKGSRDSRALLRQMGLGNPFEDPLDLWKATSPGVNTARIVTPLLLNVADREAYLSLAGYISLEDANKPVEMYIYPNEGHSKWQAAHKYHVYRRNLQWFLFWLQGREAAEPLDPDQYGRWRKLRELQCRDPVSPFREYCARNSEPG